MTKLNLFSKLFICVIHIFCAHDYFHPWNILHYGLIYLNGFHIMNFLFSFVSSRLFPIRHDNGYI